MECYLVEVFDYQIIESFVVDVALRHEDVVKRINDYIFRMTNGELSAWDITKDEDSTFVKERKPEGREYEFWIRKALIH